VATDSIILDTTKPIALSTQDRFTVERGGAVRFDAATSVDQNATFAAGVDQASAAWDFKDGTPIATGQKVTHTFNQVGTFVGELRVKDRAGNQSDARQFSVVVTPKPGETASGGGTVGPVSGGTANFSIARVRVNARYQKSKLRGSLTLTGSSATAGPLRVQLRSSKGGKARLLSTALAAGGFEETLKLPADLLPGTYRLTVAGPGGTVTSSLKLTAPREGVLRSGKLTASRRAAKATFTLANLPAKALRGRLTVSWRLGGKSLGLVKVRSATKIGVGLPAGATLTKGRLTAQLRVGRVVVGDAVARVR
jgi:PKD domain